MATRIKLRMSLSALLLTAGIATAKLNPQNFPWPNQTYLTSPLHAPVMNITKHGKSEPGFLFLTPTTKSNRQGSPTIYDDNGELIWQAPLINATDFRVQSLHNQPVLTYWDGERPPDGAWLGSVVVLNSSYDEIHRVMLNQSEGIAVPPHQAHLPSVVDMHESQITPRGTMLLMAANCTSADLRPVGGPVDGSVTDYLVYEVDIGSNEIIFRWSVLDHLALTRSYASVIPGDPNRCWDYAHLNSVALYDAGEGYIISARMLCSIIAIDRLGNILWTLDGRNGGDFTLNPGTQFCYQHDARIQYSSPNVTTISLMNNANYEGDYGAQLTTALVLDLHHGNGTVTLNRRVFNAGDPIASQSQGNCQTLGSGHLFVGYGSIPKVKEFDRHGACTFSGQFGAVRDGTYSVVDSYRAFRSPWVGLPRTLPSVFACRSGVDGNEGGIKVYVSWNGATEVREWEVFLGIERRDLKLAHSVIRNGFETVIDITRVEKCISVVRVRTRGGIGAGTESDIVDIGERC